MMPEYRDGYTIAKTGYMLHCSYIGADMKGEKDDACY